jgi:hypothetical protein
MEEKSNKERKDTPKIDLVSFMVYNMPASKRNELIQFMRDKGFKDLSSLMVHMMEFMKIMDKMKLEVNKNE